MSHAGRARVAGVARALMEGIGGLVDSLLSICLHGFMLPDPPSKATPRFCLNDYKDKLYSQDRLHL